MDLQQQKKIINTMSKEQSKALVDFFYKEMLKPHNVQKLKDCITRSIVLR